MREAAEEFQIETDLKVVELSRLIAQRALPDEVRDLIVDLREAGKTEGEAELAYVQNALRGISMYEIHEQNTPFLADNADKTPDDEDLDSWDYADEDEIPPPSIVKEEQRAAKLQAFRKQQGARWREQTRQLRKRGK
jgi:hypothetical protein